MSDIFISFAGEDRDRVQPIAEALELQGWSVWWDPAPQPGEAYPEDIEKQLFAAKCIVVVWSETSVKSRWISQEISKFSEDARITTAGPVVVPILIDDVRPPIEFPQIEPLPFVDWQADLTHERLNQFQQVVNTLIGLPPLTGMDVERAGRELGLHNTEEDGKPDERDKVPPDLDAAPTLGGRRPPRFSRPSDRPGQAKELDELPQALTEAIARRHIRNGWFHSGDEQHDGNEGMESMPGAGSALEEEPEPASPPPPVATAPNAEVSDKSGLKSRRAKSKLPTPVMLVASGIAIGGLILLGLDLLGIKILGVFNATRRASGPGIEEASSDAYPADCSVFAPPNLPSGHTIMVQVFLHPPELDEKAAVAARTFDEDAEPRGFASLSLDLELDTMVGFELRIPGLKVSDGGDGKFPWRNRVQGLQFLVEAPSECEVGPRHATLLVSADGVPVGRIHFILEVVLERRVADEPEPLGDSARRYSQAFISYAAKDRAEVLKRVQMLDRLRIGYFQDLLSLSPGDRWKEELYRQIDEADLFLLFWSTKAKNSNWVRKEVLYALECRKREPKGDPDIVPVIIEGPPPVPPPKELEDLHFNDKLLYFIRE